MTGIDNPCPKTVEARSRRSNETAARGRKPTSSKARRFSETVRAASVPPSKNSRTLRGIRRRARRSASATLKILSPIIVWSIPARAGVPGQQPTALILAPATWLSVPSTRVTPIAEAVPNLAWPTAMRTTSAAMIRACCPIECRRPFPPAAGLPADTRDRSRSRAVEPRGPVLQRAPLPGMAEIRADCQPPSKGQR